MVYLDFKFTTGRFHATPWGRNVNESVVEWPPAPYRIARAVIDVCKRRRPAWPEERLVPLVTALSGAPSFHLPPALASHTRSYLDTGTVGKPFDKQLIFDGFVVMEPGASVQVKLDADLDEHQQADLDELLAELSYLGRSESWVEARVIEDSNGVGLEWNCVPAEGPADIGKEMTHVACLRRPASFAVLDLPARKRSKKNESGPGWMEAVCMGTDDLLKEGWSAPPALESVAYLREPLERRSKPIARRPSQEVHAARYALSGKVLPRVTRTMILAETVRSYLMGIHKNVMGDPSLVSSKFSGKTPEGKRAEGHRHAFYIPLDEDRDGRIDHVEVRCVDPFDISELTALDRLRRVHHGSHDVELVLVDTSRRIRSGKASKWRSATPFISGRHHRKGRGPYLEWLEGEVRRECEIHGLPTPVSVEWTESAPMKGRRVRWMEFVRNRRSERPRRGHGCVLTFDQDVEGPFTLGAGCHFGLGLFVKDGGS